MSRFEERKAFGIEQRLSAAKIKVNPNNAHVWLENTGNPSDLLRQKQLYWQEGYDQVGADDSGIYMALPRDEVEKNVARYHKEADDRLKRPPEPDIDRRHKAEITSNTAAQGQKVSPADALGSDEEDLQ